MHSIFQIFCSRNFYSQKQERRDRMNHVAMDILWHVISAMQFQMILCGIFWNIWTKSVSLTYADLNLSYWMSEAPNLGWPHADTRILQPATDGVEAQPPLSTQRLPFSLLRFLFVVWIILFCFSKSKQTNQKCNLNFTLKQEGRLAGAGPSAG